MKVEGFVFLFVGVFLGGVDILYWFWSKDPTGTTALGISFGLGALVGGYLLFTSRRMEPRPQDRPDAEVAEGEGEIGHFSPGSYWPFFIAGSAALVLMGCQFGTWLIVLGGVFLLGSVIGLLFENEVGENAAE